MALFQIAEPGLSAAPHEHRLAVGIDLGTTNSIVATVPGSEPECIADEAGETLLPSVVRYQADGTVTVGREARSTRATTRRTRSRARSALIGRRREDLANLPRPSLRHRRRRRDARDPHRGGREEPGRSERRNPEVARRARRSAPGRRPRGGRHHGARLLRRRAASGDEGTRRASRTSTCSVF